MIMHYRSPSEVRLASMAELAQQLLDMQDGQVRLSDRTKESLVQVIQDGFFQTPSEWEKLLEIKVVNRDGWACDGKDWNSPVNRREFESRAALSTIEPTVYTSGLDAMRWTPDE